MNHIEIVSFLWGVADLTPRDVVHFMVDRLKELGTALISAAVTRKIDVPGKSPEKMRVLRGGYFHLLPMVIIMVRNVFATANKAIPG